MENTKKTTAGSAPFSIRKPAPDPPNNAVGGNRETEPSVDSQAMPTGASVKQDRAPMAAVLIDMSLDAALDDLEGLLDGLKPNCDDKPAKFEEVRYVCRQVAPALLSAAAIAWHAATEHDLSACQAEIQKALAHLDNVVRQDTVDMDWDRTRDKIRAARECLHDAGAAIPLVVPAEDKAAVHDVLGPLEKLCEAIGPLTAGSLVLSSPDLAG